MKNSRIAGAALMVAALCSVLWLAFVVTLDITYGMFPRVLVGGVKILIAIWLLIAVVVLLTQTAAIALRYVRRML